MDDFPDHGAEGGADGDSDDAVAALVLAAGQGTRMRSPLAKVLHPLAGRSLIGHVLALAVELRCAEAVVVLAPGMDTVRAEVDRLRPGTGVALHAKPSVQAECDIRVNHGDLTALLYLQGYADSDFA